MDHLTAWGNQVQIGSSKSFLTCSGTTLPSQSCMLLWGGCLQDPALLHMLTTCYCKKISINVSLDLKSLLCGHLRITAKEVLVKHELVNLSENPVFQVLI